MRRSLSVMILSGFLTAWPGSAVAAPSRGMIEWEVSNRDVK
jgi:hypothetical protein